MLARRAVRAAASLSACALATCVQPATEIFVVIGTDVPVEVPLTITARVTRAGGASTAIQTWTRVTADAGAPADGGAVLPASFAIVPGDGPRDAPVTIDVAATAGTVVLHRRAVVTYVPGASVTLPIFLTTRCLQPATGCRTTPCTQQERCEENNQTCGNNGTCVALDAPVTGGRDASFGDVPAPIVCGGFHQPCCAVGAACATTLSCVTGRCQRCTDAAEVCCSGASLLPDGTLCAPTSNPCQSGGSCLAGVCGPVTNLPDGSACSMAANACQRGGTCTGGACSGTTNAPDGTVCATTSNPCQNAGTCMAGACGAVTNLPDGTTCGSAPDTCHRAPTCAGGACQPANALPDGTPWGTGGINRCCGGSAVQLNSTAHCNACGWACAAGQSCIQLRGEPQYYCTCTANSECPIDHCCSTFYGAPYACAASNCAGGCAACPAGSVCSVDSANHDPNWCHY